MAICILTPISQDKSYCLHNFVKGVYTQDYPKEEIFWLFIVQQQKLESLSDRLNSIKERIEPEYFGVELVHYPVPVSDQHFEPRYTPHLTWKERAKIAALMRGVGIDFVKEALPEVTHILSLGCDVILNDPHDLSRLLEGGKEMISGVIYARIQDVPLVLSYDLPTKRWDWWIDYPRDQLFIADWTGMDVLLMNRRVFEGVNLEGFDVEEYSIGEDGWFCVKAKQDLGVDTWVDPFVTPYHVHKGNIIRYANPLPPIEGVKDTCPHCSSDNGIQKKMLIDVEKICPHCMRLYITDPWDHEPEHVSGELVSGQFVGYG
jgi:hypothetical protein